MSILRGGSDLVVSCLSLIWSNCHHLLVLALLNPSVILSQSYHILLLEIDFF